MDIQKLLAAPARAMLQCDRATALAKTR